MTTPDPIQQALEAMEATIEWFDAPFGDTASYARMEEAPDLRSALAALRKAREGAKPVTDHGTQGLFIPTEGS